MSELTTHPSPSTCGCYARYQACLEVCKKQNPDTYCRADCELELLLCINPIIEGQLSAARARLAEERLAAVINLPLTPQQSWWQKQWNQLGIGDSVQAETREQVEKAVGGGFAMVVAVGGPLISGLVVGLYGFVADNFGWRADAGETSGGSGSVQSFFESLNIVQIALLLVPAVYSLLVLLIMLRNRSDNAGPLNQRLWLALRGSVFGWALLTVMFAATIAAICWITFNEVNVYESL